MGHGDEAFVLIVDGAVEMVVDKNCKAYLAADAFDAVKYISRFDSVLMHTIYKLKYSKQKNK